MFGGFLGLLRRIARSFQITQCLGGFLRYVNRGEISGSQTPGQFAGVTPIGLDSLSGFAGNQRRRNNLALITGRDQPTVQLKPGWTGFVTHDKPVTFRQPLQLLLQ